MKFAVAFLLAAIPLAAHHSTKAMYDTSKIVTLEGTVTHSEWVNPHGIVYMDVKEADGKVVNWKIELPPPNFLVRQGYKKADVDPGTRVTASVWLAKDGSPMANMLTMTLTDGRVMPGGGGWDVPSERYKKPE